MQPVNSRLEELYKRWVAKINSEAELEELLDILSKSDLAKTLTPLMDAFAINITDNDTYSLDRKNILADSILGRFPVPEENESEKSLYKVHFFYKKWFRYAAILLLTAGITTFLFRAYNNPSQKVVIKQPTEIKPGGDRALLTLDDGTQIVLDTARQGTLVRKGNITITKLTNGQLAFYSNQQLPVPSLNESTRNGAGEFNTISTPRAGKYQVILPDGSKAWLNAASSIKFPSFFGKQRRVEVTGESYFEVVRDKSRPFLVSVQGSGAKETTVEVLGTRFNVNAYQDELSEKITLVEGSVKISANFLSTRQEKILIPGQAFINGLVQSVNVEQDIAWKNGLFHFENTDLTIVLRQIARWYDVEVLYNRTLPAQTFTGKLYRDINLSEMITNLQKTDIRIKLDGRKIVVN